MLTFLRMALCDYPLLSVLGLAAGIFLLVGWITTRNDNEPRSRLRW